MTRFVPNKKFPLGALFLLLLLGANTSCARLSNHISQVLLDCGSDADRNQSYVKVLDPHGQGLSGSMLVVRLNNSPAAVPVTSRGCFPRSVLAANAAILTTQYDDRSWGAIAREGDLSFIPKISLIEQATTSLTISCPAVSYTNSSVLLPIAWPKDAVEAFPARAEIKGSGLLQSQSLELTGHETFLLPTDLADGSFDVVIHYQNLFESRPTDKVVTCPYIRDRQAPKVDSSIDDRYSADLFKVVPGGPIILSTLDANPKAVHYCLASIDDAAKCSDAAAFVAGDPNQTLDAPASGKWCLSFWGEDLAANKSEVLKQCFLSYQSAAIDEGKSLAQSALALLNSDTLRASVNILRAEKILNSLPTGEEQSEIRDLIQNALASVQGQGAELNRILLDSADYSLIAAGAHVIARGPADFTLYDASGKRLGSISSQGTYAFDSKGLTLANFTSEILDVYDVHDGFDKTSAIALPGLTSAKNITIDSVHHEFLVVGPDNVVHVLRDGKESQAFTAENSDKIKISASGQILAAADSNGLQLWQRQADHWVFIRGIDSVSLGMGFVSSDVDEQLIHLDTNGKIWLDSLQASTLQSTLSVPLPDGVVVSSADFIQNLSASEVVVASGTSLQFLEWVDGTLQSKTLAKTTALNDLEAADVHFQQGLLSLRNQTQVFEVQKVLGNWQLTGSLQVSDAEISSQADLPSSFVTLDLNGRRLRFWAKNSLLRSFITDVSGSPTLKWWDDNTFVSAGYEGNAKFWTNDGTLLNVFAHAAQPSQVNDVFWNDAKSLVVSVAQDGNAVVHKPDSSIVATLNQLKVSGVPTSKWLGTGVFAKDNSSFITAGQGSSVIWKPDVSGTYQAVSVIKDSNLRFARSLPGDLQTLRWHDSDIVLIRGRWDGPRGFAFYDYNGKKRTDLWSGDGTMQDVALDRAGQNLVYAPRAKPFDLYHLTDQGLVRAASLEASDLNWTNLVSLDWSPDGHFIAGIFSLDKVVIWSIDGDSINEVGRSFLSVSGIPFYYPVWIGNTFVLKDENVVKRFDTTGKLINSWSPFNQASLIEGMAYSPNLQRLAVEADGLVKFIDLSAGSLASELCQSLSGYFQNSNEFDRVPDLTAADRELCAP